MKKIYFVVLLLISLVSVISGDISFSDEIQSYMPGFFIVADCVDMDNDSDIDLIAGQNQDLFWVENVDNFITYDVTHVIQNSAPALDGVQTKDINGDGYIDVAGHCFNGDVYLYTNNGDGSFAAPITIVPGVELENLIVEDFNNDGICEILTFSAISVNEYKINYDTGNVLCDSIGVDFVVETIGFRDIDNDGLNEFCFSGTNGQFKKITYNTNTNSLNPPVPMNVNTTPYTCYSPVFYNLNDDEYIDLITYNYSTETIECYVYNHNLGYIPTDNIQMPFTGRQPLAAHDFNNDGIDELLLLSDFDYEIYTFENGSPVQIGDFDNYLSNAGLNVNSVVSFDDVNNDGLSDIVFGNNYYTCYTNGTFGETKTFGLNFYLGDTEIIDLDNDGDADIRYMQASINADLVNDGNGSLECSALEFGNVLNYYFEIGFLNDNTIPDYVITNQQAGMLVCMDGIQDTTFILSNFHDYDNESLELQDMDNDGDLDIMGYMHPYLFFCYENDNGTFSENNMHTVNSNSLIVGVIDINNDGLKDILVNDSGNLRVMENTGNYNFVLQDPSIAGNINIPNLTECVRVDGSDLNGDGQVDLIIHRDGNSNVSYIINSNNGHFDNPTRYLINSVYANYSPVLSYDTDLDGDDEIVYVRFNHDSAEYEVAISEFDSNTDLMNTVFTSSLSGYAKLLGTGDFDNDGVMDIALKYYIGSNGISVMINQFELTPIADEDKIEISETSLIGNYPNPFNPETKINYSMAKAGNAELTIYNIKGQRVKTLINDHIEAGDHSIVWNGKDDKGTDVSSGVYFYRLKTADGVQSKKMLLLK